MLNANSVEHGDGKDERGPGEHGICDQKKYDIKGKSNGWESKIRKGEGKGE